MAPQNDGKPKINMLNIILHGKKNTDFLSHPQPFITHTLRAAMTAESVPSAPWLPHFPAIGTTRNPNSPSFATAV